MRRDLTVGLAAVCRGVSRRVPGDGQPWSPVADARRTVPGRIQDGADGGREAGLQRPLAVDELGELESRGSSGQCRCRLSARSASTARSHPGSAWSKVDPIPYQPAALAKRNANLAKRVVSDPQDRFSGDPEAKCYMPGLPRAAYMPYPFQIIQGTDKIVFAYQFADTGRIVYLGKAPQAPADSWMGMSSAKFEGDTLVVTATDFNDESWLDRAGNYHSDALKLTERFTPVSPYHLMYEATIDDAKVFTRPWKISFPLYRHMEKNARLLEFKCVELAEPFLYGMLRRPSSR